MTMQCWPDDDAAFAPPPPPWRRALRAVLLWAGALAALGSIIAALAVGA